MIKKFSQMNESISMNYTNTLISFSGDDWVGIYKDGILYQQGHSIYWKNLLKDLINDKVDLSQYKLLSINDIYDEEFWNKSGYNCPNTINELVNICKELNIKIEIK